MQDLCKTTVLWRGGAKAKHKFASLDVHRKAAKECELEKASPVPFCSALGDDLPCIEMRTADSFSFNLLTVLRDCTWIGEACQAGNSIGY